MKICKIAYRAIILIILIVMCNSCICYAAPTGANGGGGSVSGNSTTGLPTLDNSFKPAVSEGKAIDVVKSLLNFLTVLGIIAIVVSIAIIGFGAILGSASDKAISQERFVGIFIASALITGGSVIAKMIISIAESI